MTKAHVPARMAGNNHAVGRARYMIFHPSPRDATQFVHMGRSVDGGLWMYGLCDFCNRVRQPPHEARYAEFAGELKGLWSRSRALVVPSPVTPPDVIFFPGAVARAVMIGMYAMNPDLRRLYTGVADSLVNEDKSIVLPADLRLRFAIARGERARISGGDGGFVIGQLVKGEQLGFTSFGSIYFPPFAWQLVPDTAPLIERQGWADVTRWLGIDPAEERLLSTVCQTRLPLVMHPSHDPAYSQLWTELRAPKTSESVECTKLPATLLSRL